LNDMAPPTVRRIEGQRGELYGFVQDHRGRLGYNVEEFRQILANRNQAIKQQINNDGYLTDKDAAQPVIALEDWEVVHWRLKGHYKTIYGQSILEPARFIWKRLVLLEDAVLIYRLQSAPERFAIYVDVGDLPPAEALAYLGRVRQQQKKKKFINPSTNQLNLKFDAISPDEDFILPVRKGVEGTKVQPLTSPSW